MEVLEFTHNPWLVLASVCVALMAAFTGLSLTQGISQRSISQRKISVAMASVALGGGIWSMHFVAMLGLQLPILFYYDAVITLASALVAILMVGVALLILHFFERTRVTLTSAGLIVGIGVLAMHYIGMAGLQLCRAVYTAPGIALAVIAACALCVAAFWIAYGHRSHRTILLGTVCFGLAVVAVHFAAIAGTSFLPTPSGSEFGPRISNETLAIGVVLTSFVLCAAFLLTGVTFLGPALSDRHDDVKGLADPEPSEPKVAMASKIASALPVQIPYEQGGQTLFLNPASVAAIRAEGHYTQVYGPEGRVFCAWSITEAEKRLGSEPFVKTHRSYLINPAFVTGFERRKDNGLVTFDLPGLSKVPVSRGRLKMVRDTLGV